MMRLRNQSSNPPRCFFYVVPETGRRIPPNGFTSLRGCVNQVVEHLRANGYDIPGGLAVRVEEFCCRITDPGQCREDKRVVEEQVPAKFTTALRRVMQGAKSLASWWSEGVETEELARARAEVCRECLENMPIDKATCSGCQAAALNRFSQFVTGVLKGRELQAWETGLEACRVCGCPLRLKVRTRLDPIRRYMHPTQLAALPPHCWINTEH